MHSICSDYQPLIDIAHSYLYTSIQNKQPPLVWNLHSRKPTLNSNRPWSKLPNLMFIPLLFLEQYTVGMDRKSIAFVFKNQRWFEWGLYEIELFILPLFQIAVGKKRSAFCRPYVASLYYPWSKNKYYIWSTLNSHHPVSKCAYCDVLTTLSSRLSRFLTRLV